MPRHAEKCFNLKVSPHLQSVWQRSCVVQLYGAPVIHRGHMSASRRRFEDSSCCRYAPVVQRWTTALKSHHGGAVFGVTWCGLARRAYAPAQISARPACKTAVPAARTLDPRAAGWAACTLSLAAPPAHTRCPAQKGFESGLRSGVRGKQRIWKWPFICVMRCRYGVRSRPVMPGHLC